MNLNINQLRSFYYAASLSSISLAARKLMVTPPAITMQIKQLESTLEIKLVYRKGNSIELTDLGELVYSKAKPIFEGIQSLEYQLEGIAIDKMGELSVGCHHVPAKYFMPQLIGMFNETYPNVKIILQIGKTSDLIERVANHEIPLALIVGNPENPRLKVKPLIADEIILIAAAKSKIFPEKSISIQDIETLPIVIQEKKSGVTQLVLQHLKRHQVSLNAKIESASIDLLKDFVIKDTGIGFIERFAIRKELEEKQVREIVIQEGALTINLGICYLSEKNLSPMIQSFLRMLDDKEEEIAKLFSTQS
jgi:DNA-binding transcriptional LysR family regulator